MTANLTRRRFLVAAAAASLVAPARAERWEWRGSAMGGEARIVLIGPRDRAEAALGAVRAEIARLEALFSLHRRDSQLSRLNADGALEHPARQLRGVLARAEGWRRRTEGAFDVRIQPLWRHLAAGDAGPAPLGAVRGTRLSLSPARVALTPGGALSLNGIAQGTIADRVAALLARHGFRPPMIDAGELRLGPDQPLTLAHAGLVLAPGVRAAATSAPGALSLPGGAGHILDPATGGSPGFWRAVTVLAPDAETADALSTAFAVSAPERIAALVPEDVSVVATEGSGRVRRFGASVAGV